MKEPPTKKFWEKSWARFKDCQPTIFIFSKLNRTYEFAEDENDVNVCDGQKLLSDAKDRLQQRNGFRISKKLINENEFFEDVTLNQKNANI